jgi:hypothetical protein
MKKITLALLTAFSSVSMVYSQANISIEAPLHNTNFLDVLPSGASDEGTLTAVYLVNSSELSALTGTALTSLGLQIRNGVTGTAVTGSFTLYLQNTSDMTYNKGASFTTAIIGMTNAYTGNLTIPASQASSTVNLTLPQTFTYTNGGIYVGLKWQSTGPFITANANNTNLAGYPANSGTTGVNMGALEEVASGSPITDAMFMSEARPSFLFRVTNTATNEAGVLTIIAPGKVAKSVNSGHVIQAFVRNSSVNTLSNITVSLAVSGANAFTNVQTVASIAAGATATVSFASFNPTVMGVNHVSVTIPSDQNNADNTLVWTQSVTCNVMGNNPPDAIASFSGAVGFGTSGIFSTPFQIGSTATLTGVRISVSSDASNVGKQLYGVVMDATGNILANTDSIAITAALLNSFQTFKFKPGQGQVLSANTQYFIGLAQPDPSHFPMAYEQSNTLLSSLFFASPITGGALNDNSNFGYFGIEPVLGPDVSIAALTSSIICLGESLSLNGDGATSYTWSAPNTTVNAISTPTTASITVVPTKTETVVFTLKGADAAGCVNTVTISAKVAACTGIYANVLKDANINVYPNPAVYGKANIGGLEGTNTITIYNILGEVVSTKSTTDETFAIDLSAQPTGNYLVKITDSNNHSKTVKIVNQN